MTTASRHLPEIPLVDDSSSSIDLSQDWSQLLLPPGLGPQNALRNWVVRIFMPNVEEVFLSGEFNRWAVPGLPFEQVEPGVWELNLPLTGHSGIAGCFGFTQKRLNLIRHFALGRIASRNNLSESTRFELLLHQAS